jgi:hypothetical protein
MSLSIQLTLEQFNSSAQLLLRRQIAAVAGLSADNGWTFVTVQAISRRRLLQSGVSVAVTITMSSLAAADAAVSALSAPDLLNNALASVGLPPAQITSAPTVTAVVNSTPAPTPFSGCAGRGPATGLMPIASLVAAALAAVVAGRRLA